ncbi:penicillin-binding protein 1F [mine drainage metagenome]|uniref:peptidoglycan glycosyltransferase n=1 Tax=mine drainage metagenome TaxID=410659 RepID=A0A1J5SYH7_9ZZZZ
MSHGYDYGFHVISRLMSPRKPAPPAADLTLTPDDRLILSSSGSGHAHRDGGRSARPRGLWSGAVAVAVAPPAPSRVKGGGSGGKPPRPPRGGKAAGGGRRRSWGWRIIGWGVSLMIWGMIALAGVVGYYAYDLPSLDTLTATSRKPSITLLSADGQTIAAYGDVFGQPLTLAEMPKTLPEAVMATEDRHFYSHFGIDLIGTARAALADLRAGHVVQGGSTITQQLAKNLFLSPERNAKRKIQELLLALWLEHKFSKDQILTLYLNRVYLGNGSWGVDAASERYFGISARGLNLYQSALLAGLLKAPSRYNPQNDQEESLQRTTQVLANMVAFGAITPAQAQEALKTGPGTVKKISHTGRYFADWVRDQVEPYTRDGRDLVVRTTLDLALQRKVEAALDASLSGPGAKARVGQGAVVVLSPDGAVRAMAGGRDYATSQYNRATQSLRQPGSSFKAFLYLAAMESGLTPDSTIEDEPITEGKYRPGNYHEHDRYEGVITLRHALAKSSNVAAVRLIERIGPRREVEVARRLGITSDLRPDASLALGTSEVSLLELTSAYATFANNGYGVFPYGFGEIDDPRGQQIYLRQGGGTGRVIAPRDLQEMTDMLVAVVQTGTARAAVIDRPVAGKTGTTQDSRDAWFIGFSADYVAGVWMGNDDRTPMHRVTGGTLPAKLWHTVMLDAEQGLPARPLPGLSAQALPGEAAPAPAPGGGAPPPPATMDQLWKGIIHMFGG